MQQAQGVIEHIDQIALDLQALFALRMKRGLGELDVPVAEFVPEEAMQVAGHFAELVGLDALGHALGKLGQTREVHASAGPVTRGSPGV